MSNFLRVTDELRTEMCPTRPRVGIDHRTVVPTPPATESEEEPSTAETDDE
jgi:hypothetical protein